eukprot:412090-Alexandrium_andersonii.AAC.1
MACTTWPWCTTAMRRSPSSPSSISPPRMGTGWSRVTSGTSGDAFGTSSCTPSTAIRRARQAALALTGS